MGLSDAKFKVGEYVGVELESVLGSEFYVDKIIVVNQPANGVSWLEYEVMKKDNKGEIQHMGSFHEDKLIKLGNRNE